MFSELRSMIRENSMDAIMMNNFMSERESEFMETGDGIYEIWTDWFSVIDFVWGRGGLVSLV